MSQAATFPAGTSDRPFAGTRPDEGGIVTGWITRLALVFAVVGVFAYDSLAVLTARLSIEDEGASTVQTASDTWIQTHNEQQAYASAINAAQVWNPDNMIAGRSFSVSREGQVSLVLERPVETLVAKHVPPIRRWLVVRSGLQVAIGKPSAALAD